MTVRGVRPVTTAENDERAPTGPIAVVGIACRYPDAENPEQLWQNVLAGRRAFRRLPDQRMRAEDYYSPDPTAPDRFYSAKAAVIEGFEFDRVRYRVAGSTFRSTDMTHWLALDTAARALENAGFPYGEGLTGVNTGVIIGNTLTGEFSRANLMRLRWPYVRRTVGAALREQGWDDEALTVFLDSLEQRYKSAFPPIGEDTLAGGLANTIAGRICNHFDFKGGGFTVDGACSSSLLSVSTACDALARGTMDVAVAGGVDLSIDPFEVIGFAKTGALATGEMRVYDKGANGFWPGEGCGMLVLMRDEDARAQGRFRYATIAGWGYSSDGKGGITRPEASGHRLAMRRAYRTAGFGIETIGYFEGHGTGTAVGDATELRAFSEARRAAGAPAPAALSTVKGNFGHTKAAAGVAGLLKAILAVRHQVIPPATSHVDPHPELLGSAPALRVPDRAELWPEGTPIRAGVSSMGFGGINAHVVVEHADGLRRSAVPSVTRKLVASRQDAELFLLDGADPEELREKATRLAEFCAQLSYAELGDLAATLQSELDDRPLRAAVLVASPEQATERLTALAGQLAAGIRSLLDTQEGIFLGSAGSAPRIAFLFPGQGAGKRGDGGALRSRFAAVDELYDRLSLPTDGDLVATDVAQPRIVAASVAGLRILDILGIEAVRATGHSLGELTALHWAGAMDEPTVLSTAGARGRIMAAASDGDGTMAALATTPALAEALTVGEPVVIAGYNSPQQTVVSGPVAAVERVCAMAAGQGVGVARINVSHAFHSPAVAPAAAGLAEHLATERFGLIGEGLVSTVTGGLLPADTDVVDLLTRQVLQPVRFTEALQEMDGEVDLLIEVGPGHVLKSLAADILPAVPAVATEADAPSLTGLLGTVAAAWTMGAPVRHSQLFAGRFTRPLPLDKEFLFFASPCESNGKDFVLEQSISAAVPELTALAATADTTAAGGEGASSLEVLLRLAAERAELPVETVDPAANPLDELHLSSITVGQIMNQAAQELGIGAPMVTTAFATSTLRQLAGLLDELAEQSPDDRRPSAAPGVATWVRPFVVDLTPAELPGGPAAGPGGDWEVFASDRHPLAGPLAEKLRAAGPGAGVLLALPRDCGQEHIGLMLAAARAALDPDRRAAGTRLVAVGDRRGAAGLSKTLHLEAPDIPVTVVTLPLPEDITADAAERISVRIAADAVATAGFSEVHYDADGVRREPVLRAVELERDSTHQALGADDVLLITGGGKGITAECAISLAGQNGAAVGLMGRSDPAEDAELADNLARMEAAGVRVHYARADVTDVDQVKAAADEITKALGPVTGLLHGAGRNQPQALATLDEDSFRRTLATKIDGLEAVLAAIDPAALRLFVTFGSIIGRAGLRGEADYATANDWLTELTVRFQQDYPDCRCLALEWSVWSGAGMGERLGVLEGLVREGIEPIPADQGVELLGRLLADTGTPPALVVMGRAGGLPTITREQRELPLLRFLERIQVHYPGIELVADAELSGGSDLYLPDHLLDGDLLFPAVLGMEAMTQVATALTGHRDTPVLEDMRFLRPVVVPVNGTTTLRVAALVTGPGTVEAVVRSSETGFQADHFRATLRFGGPELVGDPAPVTDQVPRVPLAPDELYGPVLFQGERFQRLLGYRDLAARHCLAEIDDTPRADWFATYHPAGLVLADPGTRDALMHSIQPCVPDATLLPVSVARLHLAAASAARTGRLLFLDARERSRDGDSYLYDLDVRDEAGHLVERWEGLLLQAVRKQDGAGPWLPALLGPFLERRAEAALGHQLRCVVLPGGPAAGSSVDERRQRTSQAVSWALGSTTEIQHRPDGRPELADGRRMSSSHAAGVTFAVVADQAVTCDVEVAAERPADEWATLLGPDGLALARLLAEGRGEALSLAATRVWGAVETLRKAGHAVAALSLDGDAGLPAGWVAFRGGAHHITSFATGLDGIADPVSFTVLSEGTR
ncbi:type I polyketide synthase [Streptomyces laculatispora]|uniref:Type I polyketide synthase n=1 Tax=Streptomyces laculatispora TaxID=887464 RepID=A0ABY9IE18_9ACTN|nr:type I polyketide synthase [Streptomyces laculatispora]WLQ45090.1 type I polyketide synthase [Streptomyces laculatispora]